MNLITIFGRLTRDPEYTEEGTPRVNFSVAVDRRTRKADADKADFFRCVAWNESAKSIREYFCKGKPIVIIGRMENDPYTDKDGRLRDSWSVKVDRWQFTINDKGAGGNGSRSNDIPDSYEQLDEDNPF